jgi:recombination protein RecT
MSLAMTKVDLLQPVKSIQTARALLEGPGFMDEAVKLLRKSIPIEFFVRVALTALQRQPKLLECDGRSLCGALMSCAEARLSPCGAYGMWLTPFRNKKTGRIECVPIIDYRALKNKTVESGAATSISAALVYEGDEFSHELGDSPLLRHSPKFMSSSDADILFAYAIAWLPDKNRAYSVLSREMIDRARSRSKSQEYGPWVTDYGAMAIKTAIKRVCKLLFVPPDLLEVIQKDDEHDSPSESFVEALDLTPSEIVEPEHKMVTGSQPVAVPLNSPDAPRRRGPGRPPKSSYVTQTADTGPALPPSTSPVQPEIPLAREPGDEDGMGEDEIADAFRNEEAQQ